MSETKNLSSNSYDFPSSMEHKSLKTILSAVYNIIKVNSDWGCQAQKMKTNLINKNSGPYAIRVIYNIQYTSYTIGLTD